MRKVYVVQENHESTAHIYGDVFDALDAAKERHERIIGKIDQAFWWDEALSELRVNGFMLWYSKTGDTWVKVFRTHIK